MRQVPDWLQNLGLGQYAQRFVENDINFSILPDLTDQDLKELGVASLGHRRQLLRAIAQLSGGENTAREATTEPPTPPIETAEHRQVTVMFSDIVGSATLSGMDPKTCGKSSNLMRNASPRRCVTSVALWLSSRVTVSLRISATRWRMKMTPNEQCGPRSS